MVTSQNLPYVMASLCEYLHESPDDFIEHAEDYAFENLRVASYQDITCAFATGSLDGAAVNFVLVEGSDSINDWVRYNLKLPLVQTNVGGVHAGFHAGTAVAVQLWKQWASDLPPDVQANPLVFCGHSLGGAIAQVFASACTGHIVPVMRVVTFGQPRVGDRTWAAEYEKNFGGVTTRYVYKHDLVTAVPWMFGRYRHAGREVQLGGGKVAWLLAGIASVLPKLLTQHFDHNISNYVKALAGA